MNEIPAPPDVQKLYSRIANLGQVKRIHRNLDLLSEVLDSLPVGKSYMIYDILTFVNEVKDVENHVVISTYTQKEIRKDGWSFEELFTDKYEVIWKIEGCKQLSHSEFVSYTNEIARQNYTNTLVVEVK